MMRRNKEKPMTETDLSDFIEDAICEKAGIAALAQHFPAVFVYEPWRPHNPLAIRIDHEIRARNVMPAEDVGPALRL
jgi:hypothetical protein